MKLSLIWLAAAFMALTAQAAESQHDEELNPYADDIREVIDANDALYEKGETHPYQSFLKVLEPSCYRETCPVYIEVDKSRQRATFFLNGVPQGAEWKVTTGMKGYTTPNFDKAFDLEPNGTFRSYVGYYSSSKYPGGDYKGLGNMPYATFIKTGKGWAIHGTPEKNILRLGTVPLSHGCIRVHPDNAKLFGVYARKYGARRTWIWVHD